ncbi:MAG TPA: DUF2225 domain-containing protein [Planctomycetota bacterium]|nr:DUF2225 domain-containing protein [Planctomycetota bacterium]
MMRALGLLVCLIPFADNDKIVEVTCPVDGTKFKAVLIGKLYPLGGVDRDHCPHSGGKPQLQHLVWTCPTCYFTGLKDEFEYAEGREVVKAKSPPSAESKAKLLGKLTPIEKPPDKADAHAIAGETKFDLLAQARTLRGEAALEVAKAYLQAAWVVRETAAPSLTDFEEYNELVAKYKLNDPKRFLDKSARRSDLELEDAAKIEEDVAKGKAKGAKELLSRYLILELYRRHGENTRAAKWIADLEGRKGQNSVVDGLVPKIKATIDRERGFQRKALEHLVKAADKPGLSDADRMSLEYMIAEQHRRLEEHDKSKEWFDKVLAREKKGDESSKEFFKIAREQRALAEK